MASQKQLMPGIRDPLVTEHGSITSRRESCGDAASAAPALLPLPLASRSVHSDALRSASSALQSAWIQRLRPATENVCKDSTVHVWKHAQSALFGSSSKPLVLNGVTRDLRDAGGAVLDNRLALEGRESPTRMDSERLGKGKAKAISRRAEQQNDNLVLDNRKIDSRSTISKVAFATPVSPVLKEGAASFHGGGNEACKGNCVLSNRGKVDAGDTAGTLMTGFGPLQVRLKPSAATVDKWNSSGGSETKQSGALEDRRREQLEALVDNLKNSGPGLAGGCREQLEALVEHLKQSGTGLDSVRHDNYDLPAEHDGMQIRVSLVDRKGKGKINDGAHQPLGYRTDFTEDLNADDRSEWPSGASVGARAAAVGNAARATEDHDNGQPVQSRHRSMPYESYGPRNLPFRSMNEEAVVAGIPAFGDAQRPVQHTHFCNPSNGAWHSALGNFERRSASSQGNPSSMMMGLNGGNVGGMEGVPYSRAVLESNGNLGYAGDFHSKQKSKKQQDPFGSMYPLSGNSAVMGKTYQRPDLLKPVFSPYQPSHYCPGTSAFGRLDHPLPFSSVTTPFGRTEGCQQQEDPLPMKLPGPSKHPAPVIPSSAPNKPQQEKSRGAPRRADQNFFGTELGLEYVERPTVSSSAPAPQPGCRPKQRDGYILFNLAENMVKANKTLEKDVRPMWKETNQVTSVDTRSHWDNQSSHVSSSPMPDHDSAMPMDDPADAGSSMHSQNSRFALNFHTTDNVGSLLPNIKDHGNQIADKVNLKDAKQKCKEVLENKETAAASTSLENNILMHFKAGRDVRYANEANMASSSGIPLNQLIVRFHSGGQEDRKDDSSGSSPPSLPSGYRNSLFHSLVDEQWTSTATHSNPLDLGSDSGYEYKMSMHHASASTVSGKDFRKRQGNSSSQVEEHVDGWKDSRESGGRFHSDGSGLENLPTVTEKYRGDMINRFAESGAGEKHVRGSYSNEVLGDAIAPVPCKRSRLDSMHSSQDCASQADDKGGSSSRQVPSCATENPSWLKRWLPPSNSAGKTSGRPDIPNDAQWKLYAGDSPVGNRGRDMLGSANQCSRIITAEDRTRDRGEARMSSLNAREGTKSFKEFRVRRSGVYGLPPIHTPSVAALAMVGPAARKLGTFTSQRMGPISTWPSISMPTSHAPHTESMSIPSELP